MNKISLDKKKDVEGWNNVCLQGVERCILNYQRYVSEALPAMPSAMYLALVGPKLLRDRLMLVSVLLTAMASAMYLAPSTL